MLTFLYLIASWGACAMHMEVTVLEYWGFLLQITQSRVHIGPYAVNGKYNDFCESAVNCMFSSSPEVTDFLDFSSSELRQVLEQISPLAHFSRRFFQAHGGSFILPTKKNSKVELYFGR